MIVKSLKWVLIYLLIENVCVLSQICSARRVVMKREMESKHRWYRETYHGQCYYGCIRTRWATKIEQVPVTKREIQVYHVCCDGYIFMIEETNGLANETMVCKPICMPACKNGFCTSPGICACNPGYTADPADKHNCLPLCLKDCQHGTCIAPETCQCDFGYNILDGTCQPVCTEPCDNGTCVSPETCECLPGYRKSDRNICEPYCSIGCLYGSCVSPETCVCSIGFSMQVIDSENNTSCQPECLPPCLNGTCIAPNVCQCNSGHQISGLNNCMPHCSNGCPNGSCISPETCICDKGWRMDNDTECKPICDTDCGNGTCVSANTCDCHPGYKINEVNSHNIIEAPMCIPICDNCEGTCVDPNVCICDAPFEAYNQTADGKPCNCNENCTDEMRKCERTSCMIVNRESVEKSFDNDKVTEELSFNGIDNTNNDVVTLDFSHTTDFLSDRDSEASTIKSKSLVWIYLAITAFVIFIILCITIVVVKWKYIIIYFKGSSYVVEDDKEIAAFECSLRLLKEKREVNKTRNNESRRNILNETKGPAYS